MRERENRLCYGGEKDLHGLGVSAAPGYLRNSLFGILSFCVLCCRHRLCCLPFCEATENAYGAWRSNTLTSPTDPPACTLYAMRAASDDTRRAHTTPGPVPGPLGAGTDVRGRRAPERPRVV